MIDTRQFLVDLAAGVGLFLALLLVFFVDRHFSAEANTSPTYQATNELNVRFISASESANSRFFNTRKKLRMAVTPTWRSTDPFTKETFLWDDMGKLLNALGEGYRYDNVEPAQIAADPKLLDIYDVLFLTCAPEGTELRSALQRFVSRGGTLYASDWRYDAVVAAFPEVADPPNQGFGFRQDVLAEVVDPTLREIVGPTIPLSFDLPDWKVAAFKGPRVTVLLRGEFRRKLRMDDTRIKTVTAPLLVKFTYNNGTVIFTSFHNEKQNSDHEKKLLDYLVFSIVTANINAEVITSFDEAGFTSAGSNLLSTAVDNPSIQKTYDNPRTGPLRVALGFRSEGATLRLALTSPAGKKFTWEGDSTVLLEIPEAATGKWTYTVTAVHLPYANFPFTVTFGEKK